MEKIRIGDACDILNGFAFKSDKYVEDGIRVIRIANVQKGYIEDNAPAFYPIDSTGLEKYMLEEGDLLMSLTGNVGRVAILQSEMLPAALNQRVACLRMKTDKLTKGFLFHILNSDFFEQQCIQASNGVAQKNMSTEWLKDYEIPLYSIEEQLKITEILDKTRKVIYARGEELRNLDNLIKARFVELFGDPMTNPKGFPVKTIEDISFLNKGITYSPEDVAEEGMIVLRSSNIKGNVFDLEDLVKVTKKVSPDKFVQENDILMCNRNGSARLVGKVAMIPKLEENMTFGTFMTIVRSDIYEYLFTFFQMDAFREQIKFQTAVAINQISLPLLASVKVPVPPRELLDEFAVFTKQVDKSKFI